MSRDYKGIQRRRAPYNGGSSLLTGILIGLVLGLGIALATAWYINRMPSPFKTRGEPPPRAAPAPAKPGPPPVARAPEPASAPAEDKPRFDFYKILPGSEEPALLDPPREAPKASTASPNDAFYLQAGAFQNAPDADNLKARLALLGIEAMIETTTLADKGVWHRVRVGPYTSVEEVNRIRDTLKQNGVQTTLIRVREPQR
jgi:cell division protein FtsN